MKAVDQLVLVPPSGLHVLAALVVQLIKVEDAHGQELICFGAVMANWLMRVGDHLAMPDDAWPPALPKYPPT